MGFDEYIYIIRVLEDGHVFEYEFGNQQHALEMLIVEKNAFLYKYANGKEYLIK